MKKNRAFVSAIILMAIASVSCAQSSDKRPATLATASGPALRWKYESGG